MVRIILADDHALIREGLRRILELQGDFEIVAEAKTGQEAIDVCKNVQPDVLLLDFNFPDMDGFHIVEAVRKENSDIKIVVLTMYDSENLANRFLAMGVKGYVIKGEPTKTVIEAIRKVMTGKVYLPHDIMERILAGNFSGGSDSDLMKNLSNREMQIFRKLAKGDRNTKIAEDLKITPSTVNSYRMRIMEKMSFKNRSELVQFAIKHRIIESQ